MFLCAFDPTIPFIQLQVLVLDLLYRILPKYSSAYTNPLLRLRFSHNCNLNIIADKLLYYFAWSIALNAMILFFKKIFNQKSNNFIIHSLYLKSWIVITRSTPNSDDISICFYTKTITAGFSLFRYT